MIYCPRIGKPICGFSQREWLGDLERDIRRKPWQPGPFSINALGPSCHTRQAHIEIMVKAIKRVYSACRSNYSDWLFSQMGELLSQQSSDEGNVYVNFTLVHLDLGMMVVDSVMMSLFFFQVGSC
jgi:hypothetical protein